MFHSDLEVFRVGKEQQKDRLRESIRREMVRRCRDRCRSRLLIWLGNQLIVLGEHMKGGKKS